VVAVEGEPVDFKKYAFGSMEFRTAGNAYPDLRVDTDISLIEVKDTFSGLSNSYAGAMPGMIMTDVPSQPSQVYVDGEYKDIANLDEMLKKLLQIGAIAPRPTEVVPEEAKYAPNAGYDKLREPIVLKVLEYVRNIWRMS